MKKRRKRLIILAILGVIAWRAWPVIFIFTSLNLKTSSDFSKLAQLVPPGSRPTAAFDGLSHPFYEGGDLLGELLFKPRKMVHGHAFGTVQREDPIIESIAEILSEPNSFDQWGGEKACGGFSGLYPGFTTPEMSMKPGSLEAWSDFGLRGAPPRQRTPLNVHLNPMFPKSFIPRSEARKKRKLAFSPVPLSLGATDCRVPSRPLDYGSPKARLVPERLHYSVGGHDTTNGNPMV